MLSRYAALFEAHCEADWVGALTTFAAQHGFERLVFAVVPNRAAGIEHGYLQSTYPKRWRAAYDRSALALIDPTVLHCRTRSVPLIWSADLFASKAQKELHEEAVGHGLKSGVTLPIHGPDGIAGMLGLASDRAPSTRTHAELIETLPALTLLRDIAFERSQPFYSSCIQAKRPSLTARELECVKWLVANKSSWDIAQILNISSATVNFHIANIRAKLGVNSRRVIAVKAVQLGLVSLDC